MNYSRAGPKSLIYELPGHSTMPTYRGHLVKIKLLAIKETQLSQEIHFYINSFSILWSINDVYCESNI